MANKKRIEERLKAAEQKRAERRIQWIGGGVLALLVLSGLWFVFGKPGPCEPFADIPVSAQYSQPPLLIDPSSRYFANVKMENGGEFRIQLYPAKAPITVNSFVFLSCKGFFNGITFHRVLDGFMAQTGDPTGTGAGGPGYQFVNEDNDLLFDKEGVVAMANSGRDTNGSQFFITFAPAAHLNGGYTIFGQLIDGMDVVNAITRRDPSQFPDFQGDVIDSITITRE